MSIAEDKPLVISRIIYHSEIQNLFQFELNEDFMRKNEGQNKNLNTCDVWKENIKGECYFCEKWKYSIIFFTRKYCKKNFKKLNEKDLLEVAT